MDFSNVLSGPIGATIAAGTLIGFGWCIRGFFLDNRISKIDREHKKECDHLESKCRRLGESLTKKEEEYLALHDEHAALNKDHAELIAENAKLKTSLGWKNLTPPPKSDFWVPPAEF